MSAPVRFDSGPQTCARRSARFSWQELIAYLDYYLLDVCPTGVCNLSVRGRTRARGSVCVCVYKIVLFYPCLPFLPSSIMSLSLSINSLDCSSLFSEKEN